jgi:simple sugar transport system permease protein
MSAAKDERIKEISRFRRAIIRPELGAVCGTIAVFVFFFVLAGGTAMFSLEGAMSWSTVSAQFVVLAVGVCLLMIAGEFDLSLGSMVGFSGMIFALLTIALGLPVWLSILLALMLACALGAINGILVVRTGLPSFIVTLAFMFILRGLTIWSAISLTRQTVVSGMSDAAANDPLAKLFGAKVFTGLFQWLANHGVIATFARGARAGQPVVDGIPMLIVWAIGLLIFGNGCSANQVWQLDLPRGDPQAARYVGCAGHPGQIIMFMFASFCAAVLGIEQVVEFGCFAAIEGSKVRPSSAGDRRGTLTGGWIR